MRRPIPAVLAPAALAGLAALAPLVAASCGGDSSEDRATVEPTTTTTSTDPAVGATPDDATTAPPPRPDGDDSGGEPRVVDFVVPSEVACAGGDAVVALRYQTEGATLVAFIVDNRAATTGEAPPLSGEYSLTLPCDGNAHTVVLAAASPSGPALDTRVVRTVPSGDPAPEGTSNGGG